MNETTTHSRRNFLRTLGGSAALLAFGNRLVADPAQLLPIRKNVIPSTGEEISAIGMGTYITFNVGPSQRLRRERARVLQTFFDLGGGMIDSSPMYGSSEEVIGYCLRHTTKTDRMFSATKVWTRSDSEGPEQIADSERFWGLRTFDLLQIHNLLNWEDHLSLLRKRKEEGSVRYIGVTTSHGRRHAELADILRNEPIDFVQLTYNIDDRQTEDLLIPLARERGIAVIVNRPYDGGSLMDRYQSQPLPQWASEEGVTTWADFFLKFILSLPGVTCAIPATSRVDHMKENMGALHGPLPSAETRMRMIRYLAEL